MNGKYFICEECKKEVLFPDKITVESLSVTAGYDVAKSLFLYRDSLNKKLSIAESTNNMELISSLQENLNNVEERIVRLSDGYSKEYDDFFGIYRLPKICKDCNSKIKFEKNDTKLKM